MAHAHGSPSEDGDETTQPANGLASGLRTALWGLGGFTALILIGVLILREHRWTFTAKDFLYWIVVAAMIVARAIDAARIGGGGDDDSRSAPRVVVRYAITLLALAGLGWALAQSFRV